MRAEQARFFRAVKQILPSSPDYRNPTRPVQIPTPLARIMAAIDR
jgi:hypothetical protein